MITKNRICITSLKTDSFRSAALRIGYWSIFSLSKRLSNKSRLLIDSPSAKKANEIVSKNILYGGKIPVLAFESNASTMSQSISAYLNNSTPYIAKVRANTITIAISNVYRRSFIISIRIMISFWVTTIYFRKFKKLMNTINSTVI